MQLASTKLKSLEYYKEIIKYNISRRKRFNNNF